MSNLHKLTQEDLETIERYLNGSLSPEASSVFEKQMEENIRLKHTVSEFKQLFSDLEGAVLKHKMQDFHASMEHKEKEQKVLNEPSQQKESLKHPLKRNKRPQIYNYAIAASTVILIIITGLWYMKQPTEYEKLFATYFTPDPGLITPMSSQTAFVFYDAMVDYKREDYDSAIQKWEGLLAQKQTNDTLNYFIGVSHLAKGDAHSAVPYLKIATDDSQSIFIEDAHFFLGMAYLKLEAISQAKEAFSKSKHENSSKVLNKLE